MIAEWWMYKAKTSGLHKPYLVKELVPHPYLRQYIGFSHHVKYDAEGKPFGLGQGVQKNLVEENFTVRLTPAILGKWEDDEKL